MNVTSSMGSLLTRPPVLLRPLLHSLTELKYNHIRCLHVWHINLSEEELVSLVSVDCDNFEFTFLIKALFMVNPIGSQIRVLDLTNTNVTMWGIQRLSRYRY